MRAPPLCSDSSTLVRWPGRRGGRQGQSDRSIVREEDQDSPEREDQSMRRREFIPLGQRGRPCFLRPAEMAQLKQMVQTRPEITYEQIRRTIRSRFGIIYSA